MVHFTTVGMQTGMSVYQNTSQQPHREHIEEEQPAQADEVDSPEQINVEDDTTMANDDSLRIRALPKILTKAVEQLSPTQRQTVKDIGLGRLLDLQITNLPRQMWQWLVENFDIRSCTLQLQNRQTIHITTDDVAAVLGLPKGHIEITKRTANALPKQPPPYSTFYYSFSQGGTVDRVPTPFSGL
nr:uncharacterized protein LOC109191529 [Ipomoea trifida]